MSVNLGPSVGSVLIGSTIASVLYGISCAQLVYYLRHYPGDMRSMKALVFGLWLLETALTYTDYDMTWLFLVQNRSNYAALTDVPKAWIVDNTAASLLVAIVQTFYIHTIWQLQAKSVFRTLITVLSEALVTATFGATLAISVISSSELDGDVIANSKIPILIKTISAILADICICSTLVITLRKRKTGIHRTNGIVQTLMVYLFNRALLTLLMQVVLLGVYVISIRRNAMLWAILNSPTSRIYYGSMMAVLNARAHIKAQNTAVAPNSIRMNEICPRHNRLKELAC